MKLQRQLGHHFGYETVRSSKLLAAHDEVLALPAANWDRYENPFEQKFTLRDKFHLPPVVGLFIKWLEEDWRQEAQELYGVELHTDISRHYAGVFRYEKGDHLSVHVDAGIHPTTHIRKHVTALLYLSTGQPLELWRGDICTAANPRPRELAATIEPQIGQLVLFENNDYAWHGVATASQQRLVLTVSYLSQQLDAFENRRQRAFFVPRLGERWTKKTLALRDRRVDPDAYKEVYRASA